jgi:hypothetical protein
MHRDDDPGDVLDDVARIHPAVERLRHLVASATLLDLKATADGYWTDRPAEGDGPTPPEPSGSGL